MKTTMDLPDDLVREMKLRAVQEGKKLQQLAAEVIRRGLATPERPAAIRHRVHLPIVPAPAGAPKFELTGEQIHALETETEMRSHEASLRH